LALCDPFAEAPEALLSDEDIEAIEYAEQEIANAPATTE
jgi:hypothetical protein